MVGNVWEWCATRWRKDSPYKVAENDGMDDYLAGDSAPMLRGGSWLYNQNAARCTFRRLDVPNLGDLDIVGFRVIVVSPISPPAP
jgi:formylglycine-generating enzyme required for sulfatase activity